MMHDAYTDRLSDYLDDEDLSPEERNRVTAHLAACATCRAVLAELREIRQAAMSLSDTDPVSDPWPGIAGRIRTSGPPGVTAFPQAASRRHFSFTLPQLVAASLALMTLSGGTVWLARYGGSHADFEPIQAQVAEPVQTIDALTGDDDRAIAELQRALDRDRPRIDPETLRVIDDSLRTIDDAIDQCRRALDEDRSNVYLASHLVSSQKRKLAILRRVSGLAGSQP